MRTFRILVIAGLIVKVAVLGTWWATRASAEGQATAPVASSLMQQSRGFREMLEAVAARQKQLDEREQALASREAGLGAVEKAVADQVGRLEALAGGPARGAVRAAAPAGGPAGAPAAAVPASAPASAGGEKAPASDRPVEITRIYESMKAEEAAPILDKLDDDTLRVVLGRMKERQVGAILAAMNRERAVAFTKLLVHGPAADGPEVAQP